MSKPREFYLDTDKEWYEKAEGSEPLPDSIICVEKSAADKLAEAIIKAMDETPIHECCYDILEQALKEYRGEK